MTTSSGAQPPTCDRRSDVLVPSSVLSPVPRPTRTRLLLLLLLTSSALPLLATPSFCLCATPWAITAFLKNMNAR